MTFSNTAGIFLLIVSTSCGSNCHNVIGRVCILDQSEKVCNIGCRVISSFVAEHWCSSQDSQASLSKTSLSGQVVTFDLGPGLLKKCTPHDLFSVVSLGKKWECVCCTAIVYEENLGINREDPRPSSDVELNSNDVLIILGVSHKVGLWNSWKFTNGSQSGHKVAGTCSSLLWLDEFWRLGSVENIGGAVLGEDVPEIVRG